jgi:hypothetical protein
MPDKPRTELVRALEDGALTVATAEQLLGPGADLEAVSKWWTHGMNTRRVNSEVARLLVERGATLTPRGHVSA